MEAVIMALAMITAIDNGFNICLTWIIRFPLYKHMYSNIEYIKWKQFIEMVLKEILFRLCYFPTQNSRNTASMPASLIVFPVNSERAASASLR